MTGIGFIGAGVILREHGVIVGLTTAATIFVVAAIGMAVGAALWWPSVVATAIVLVTLLALIPIERWLRQRRAGISGFLADNHAADIAASAHLAAELSSVLARYHLRVEPFSNVQNKVESSNQQKDSQ